MPSGKKWKFLKQFRKKDQRNNVSKNNVGEMTLLLQVQYQKIEGEVTFYRN